MVAVRLALEASGPLPPAAYVCITDLPESG